MALMGEKVGGKEGEEGGKVGGKGRERGEEKGNGGKIGEFQGDEKRDKNGRKRRKEEGNEPVKKRKIGKTIRQEELENETFDLFSKVQLVIELRPSKKNESWFSLSLFR